MDIVSDSKSIVVDYHPPATWSSDYQVLKSMVFADVKGNTQQVRHDICSVVFRWDIKARHSSRRHVKGIYLRRKDWRVFMFLKRTYMIRIVTECSTVAFL